MRGLVIIALAIALAACSKSGDSNLASAGAHLNAAAGQTVDAAKDAAKAAGPEVRRAGEAAGDELHKAGDKVKRSADSADHNRTNDNTAD